MKYFMFTVQLKYLLLETYICVYIWIQTQWKWNNFTHFVSKSGICVCVANMQKSFENEF